MTIQITTSIEGVPQGSTLGPIPFNFVVNGAILQLQTDSSTRFADDNVVWRVAANYQSSHPTAALSLARPMGK